MSPSSRRSGAALLGAAAASLIAASAAHAVAPEVYAPYASPASARTGTPVSFQGSAYDPDDSQVSFAWDFVGGTGFGAFSAESAEHVFSTDGLHSLAMRARDGQGETADLRIAYATHPDNWNPVVEFGGAHPSITQGEANEFGQHLSLYLIHDDSPRSGISATWDLDGNGSFGDGDPVEGSTIDRVAHFTTDGDHPVKAKVTDGQGGETVVSAVVRTHTANEAPELTSHSGGVAYAVEDVALGHTALYVSVDDDYTSDLTFSWTLDGAPHNSTRQLLTLPRDTPVGRHTAEITVSDDGRGPGDTTGPVRTSTKVIEFSVVEGYPAEIGAYSAMTQAHEENSFRTLENIRLYAYPGSGKPATAYEWDLDGDGQYDDAAGYSTWFAFPNKGTYTVAARITLAEGAPVILSRQVVVDSGQDYAPVAQPINAPGNNGGGSVPPALTPEQIRAAMAAFLSAETIEFLQAVAKANRKGISAAKPVLSLGTLGPDQLPNGGTARFDVYDKAGKAATASAKRKKLGSTTVTLAKGAKKAVKVKLNAKGKSLLRKKGKVKLTVDATVTDALTGATAAKSRTYTFKVAKRKKR